MTAEEQYRAVPRPCRRTGPAPGHRRLRRHGHARRSSSSARQARAPGADAVLLSAPPYNKPPQRGLLAHFRAVMDAADLPAIIYNVPGRAAVNILPETVARWRRTSASSA
jgi:dihydrodipicolinate synthase/N-acetylneuraminate lyase